MTGRPYSLAGRGDVKTRLVDVVASQVLPLWLVIAGNAVMIASLWLLGAGGMMAKLILLIFWVMMLAAYGRNLHFKPAGLVGGLILCALIGLIGLGDGSPGEKIRLAGNLMMLPVGLAAGYVIGRDCLRILVPSLALYLVLSSSFYLTHEGFRLNHAFLLLGFFALCSVMALPGGRWAGGVAAITILLSQTRIAVIAMLINLVGGIRFGRAVTVLVGVTGLGIMAALIAQYLPRLLMTHDSGRLVFWQEFADLWRDGPPSRQWLGFGAGSVEEILSGSSSFASFGALHNDHFRILFETGMVGAILWLWAWGMMIWSVRQVRLSVCILISVFVTMVTDNSLNYGHYLMCAAIASGIAAHTGGPRE
ncbi:O-antigen ligase family protein [Thalassospira sp. SM2505]|uniref:O-antigen ligase domain-containing protein n=1 Tax=Thalassospira profundimaris TaxID=502049 RepID=UPI00215D7695|nr:O-antigen ligase domain-containing protein [Thalassospira profundimaris]